ncbi:MAG: signal peptidase II [Clostridiaceae bacterium]|nr:signal peptidase II [Clostridiaceae bacterium]
MKKTAALWALIPLCIIAADQMVKQWAQNNLQQLGTLPLISGVFHLTYARNTGAAFSLLQGARWAFVLIGVLMVGLLIWALRAGWVRGLFGRLSVLFLVGGAVGNLIDRVRFGYVVDLFDFRLIHFAIFNVADSFITVGGIMLGIYLIFIDRRLLQKEHSDGNTSGSGQ